MEVQRTQNVASGVVFPLIDSANRPDRKAAATLAAGDFKIINHTGAAWNAAANTATTTPTDLGSGLYYLPLTQGELNPDDTQYPVIIVCSDAAGAEWDDQAIVIWTKPLAINLVEMGGVVQSATDLKDFADAGYDPGTNKVQGVVLVDTTTTNTDVRGTDGANTTVPDVAGTAAGLHGTTDGKIDVVDAIVDDLKAALILVDTTIASDGRGTTSCRLTAGSDNDDMYIGMQVILDSDAGDGEYVSRTITDYASANKVVTWTPAIQEDAEDGGQIYIVPGETYTNVLLAAITAKMPTNYVMGSSDQTDKDDEIDAIKAKTDNLPADPASETNVNANETKIDALNDLSAAQVNAECDTALADYGANTTTPPTAAANADAVWDEDIVSAHDEETDNGKKAATKVMNIFRRLYKKVTQTNTTQKVYKNDNSTELASMTSSDDGTTQTKGGVSE